MREEGKEGAGEGIGGITGRHADAVWMGADDDAPSLPPAPFLPNALMIALLHLSCSPIHAPDVRAGIELREKWNRREDGDEQGRMRRGRGRVEKTGTQVKHDLVSDAIAA